MIPIVLKAEFRDLVEETMIPILKTGSLTLVDEGVDWWASSVQPEESSSSRIKRRTSAHPKGECKRIISTNAV